MTIHLVWYWLLVAVLLNVGGACAIGYRGTLKYRLADLFGMILVTIGTGFAALAVTRDAVFVLLFTFAIGMPCGLIFAWSMKMGMKLAQDTSGEATLGRHRAP